MAEHALMGYKTCRQSRFYLDPTAKNGPVIVTKPADPVLLEKNKEFLNKGQYRYKSLQHLEGNVLAPRSKTVLREMKKYIQG